MKNDQLAIMNEIRNESHKMESLSIGVTMTIGEYAIVDKIADFLISHPEINLHIHYGNTTQLLTLLDEGRINLALVEGNYPKENYEHKNYSTEEYIAVCARDHTFKEKFPETMQELVKERLLVREPGSGTRNILEELLLARGMGIKDFLHYTEVENMHTIIGLLKRDCGISFMYKIAVADELKNGTLKEIRLFRFFRMQHAFDFIWEKGSIYTEKYIGKKNHYQKPEHPDGRLNGHMGGEQLTMEQSQEENGVVTHLFLIFSAFRQIKIRHHW